MLTTCLTEWIYKIAWISFFYSVIVLLASSTDGKMFAGRILMLPCLGLAWSVNVELDSALRSDSHWQESRNSGTYLRDSFRSQVLIPAFNSVIRGLTQNEEADKIYRIAYLASLLPIVLALIYVAFLLKCKHRRRVILPVGNEKDIEAKEFKLKLSGKE